MRPTKSHACLGSIGFLKLIGGGMTERSQSRTIKVIVFVVQAIVVALCVLWFVLFGAMMIPVIAQGQSEGNVSEVSLDH